MLEHISPPHYCAYLLRCWAEHGQSADHPVSWRFSLEDPHTGKRFGFANLEALVTFLQTAMAGGRDESVGG